MAHFEVPREFQGPKQACFACCGDEYVKLKIVVPSSPTAREKELFENLAAESRFNPREPLAGRG
jgi:DnaJ-class molecular chaperone